MKKILLVLCASLLFQDGVFHAASRMAKVANGKVSATEVTINDD